MCRKYGARGQGVRCCIALPLYHIGNGLPSSRACSDATSAHLKERSPFAATRGSPEGGCDEAASAIPLPYFPAFTSSSAISRSLNFCTFMDGVMGKSSTKNTRLGTL